jgi:hypothetical protein
MYASIAQKAAALQLALFEQPASRKIFQYPVSFVLGSRF